MFRHAMVFVPPVPACQLIYTCGGVVSATGSTPAGAFAADAVGATVNPCAGFISVALADDAHIASVVLGIPYPVPDAGTEVPLGDVSVTATLVSDAFLPSEPSTAGTVDVTAADYPEVAGDAGPPGHIAGSFTLAQDGFSLTGTFSTSYCGWNNGSSSCRPPLTEQSALAPGTP
jgi:hypothetical protein